MDSGRSIHATMLSCFFRAFPRCSHLIRSPSPSWISARWPWIWDSVILGKFPRWRFLVVTFSEDGELFDGVSVLLPLGVKTLALALPPKC